eukprot:GEZU01025237.1.p1 GENE.GEZU01025237.1~~GEZU01025237.1.p1  ORF type:complete len:135 (-),score=25.51 GEZU01025237.1:138-542(-)
MIITNSTTIMKRFVSKVIPTLLNNSAINPAARSICLSCANNASIPLTTSTRVSPTKSIAITLPQHQRMHISDFPQQQQQQQQIAMAMVQQLSAITGMNQAFSAQCLADNQWDFNRALQRFHELRGQIPPQAFTH